MQDIVFFHTSLHHVFLKTYKIYYVDVFIISMCVIVKTHIFYIQALAQIQYLTNDDRWYGVLLDEDQWI